MIETKIMQRDGKFAVKFRHSVYVEYRWWELQPKYSGLKLVQGEWLWLTSEKVGTPFSVVQEFSSRKKAKEGIKDELGQRGLDGLISEWREC